MSKRTPGCGCVAVMDESDLAQPIIIFCPTHAAAPEMVELLHRIVDALAVGDGEVRGATPEIVQRHENDARALLARIEGK